MHTCYLTKAFYWTMHILSCLYTNRNREKWNFLKTVIWVFDSSCYTKRYWNAHYKSEIKRILRNVHIKILGYSNKELDRLVYCCECLSTITKFFWDIYNLTKIAQWSQWQTEWYLYSSVPRHWMHLRWVVHCPQLIKKIKKVSSINW
jgi:hypothetical protein